MNRFEFQRPKLLFDVGSANTRVYLDEKLVFSEATCIAYHQRSKSVVAIGNKALSLLGKTPSSIKLGFPIQNGSIANTKLFELFMQVVVERVLFGYKLQRMVLGLSGNFLVMDSLSPAKKNLLLKSLKSLGFLKVELKSTPYLLASENYGEDIKKLDGVCIIDIGAQKTEISVFALNELVATTSFKWGGIKFTEVLQQKVRTKYQCVVSWHLAEEAKKQVGSLLKVKQKFALRGKDLITQGSKTVILSADDLYADYSLLLDDLLVNIQEFFATLPSEIAILILEKGVFLVGEGSRLKGIDTAIRDRLKCDVFLTSKKV